MSNRQIILSAIEAAGVEHPAAVSYLRDLAGYVHSNESLDRLDAHAVRLERWYDQDSDGGPVTVQAFAAGEKLDFAPDPDEAAEDLTRDGYSDLSDASQPMVSLIVALTPAATAATRAATVHVA